MSNPTRPDRPAFKGLTWHRDQYYSLFAPVDWQKVMWPDGRQGMILLPNSEDLHTLFAIEVIDLGTEVTSDDVPYLAQGLRDGIKALQDRKIEMTDESVVGRLVELEARYSFVEAEERRKRWVRVLYHKTHQVTVTAQGATEDAYAYWLPMFNEAMMTIKVHDIVPKEPTT
ncbi:MAG: hypothetical protein KC708_08535 [Anaerolineae bacterium]|nr:hypothetical protein [Anaerolineae bacterium]